ncbi:TPA: hypothetical protein OMT82_000396 [Enterobacter cloacae]|nr:hypothetical protein [Enterobacter cloacae]HCR0905044.1 hypothetical protein [Enterobacter cloacae]
MNITLHFTNGSTTITDGTYSGYEYSRHDKLITAHISIDAAYSLYIDQYSITAKYKYITVVHNLYFTVGRWRYPWCSLDTYTGTEARHLTYLSELINEAIEHDKLNGRPIECYRISEVLKQFKGDDY